MTVTIQNARRGKLRLAFGVILTPGNNEIDAAAWAQCKDHPVTMHYRQRGDVAEVAAASGSRLPTSSNLVRDGIAAPSREHEPDDPDAARYGEPVSPPLPMAVETPVKGLETSASQQDDSTSTNAHPVSTPVAARDVTVPDLADMRAKDAITALLSIDCKWTLRQLLANERRATVTRAITRRLGELGVRS